MEKSEPMLSSVKKIRSLSCAPEMSPADSRNSRCCLGIIRCGPWSMAYTCTSVSQLRHLNSRQRGRLGAWQRRRTVLGKNSRSSGEHELET